MTEELVPGGTREREVEPAALGADVLLERFAVEALPSGTAAGAPYTLGMLPTVALLDLSSDWVERTVAVDEVLLAEGSAHGSLFVLIEGHLVVRRGDEVLAVIDQPGACVGEMALLLDRAHSATVAATDESRVRVLPDAGPVLRASPELLLPVAQILASRLHLVTAYLGDLRQQYAGTDHGLGLVSDVLGRLVQHHGEPLDPGSEREPDAPY